MAIVPDTRVERQNSICAASGCTAGWCDGVGAAMVGNLRGAFAYQENARYFTIDDEDPDSGDNDGRHSHEKVIYATACGSYATRNRSM